MRGQPGFFDVDERLKRFSDLADKLIKCIDEMPTEALEEIYSRRINALEALWNSYPWDAKRIKAFRHGALSQEIFSPKEHIAAALIGNLVTPPQMPAFRNDLGRLIRRVILAESALADITSPKQPRRLPREVTEVAAMAYTALTGRRAYPGHDGSGKRSPFERFLRRVFDALEIDASSEAQAKNYARGKSPAK